MPSKSKANAHSKKERKKVVSRKEFFCEKKVSKAKCLYEKKIIANVKVIRKKSEALVLKGLVNGLSRQIGFQKASVLEKIRRYANDVVVITNF